MLSKTQWNGAPACTELVGQIDLLIARLYNRAEPAFMRGAQAAAASSPGDAAPEDPVDSIEFALPGNATGDEEK